VRFRPDRRVVVLVAAGSLVYLLALISAEEAGFAAGLGQRVELASGVPRTARYGPDPVLPQLQQLDPAVALEAAQEAQSGTPSPSASASASTPTVTVSTARPTTAPVAKPAAAPTATVTATATPRPGQGSPAAGQGNGTGPSSKPTPKGKPSPTP